MRGAPFLKQMWFFELSADLTLQNPGTPVCCGPAVLCRFRLCLWPCAIHAPSVCGHAPSVAHATDVVIQVARSEAKVVAPPPPKKEGLGGFLVIGKETSFFHTYYLLPYYYYLLLLLLLLATSSLVTASQLALVATKEESSVWPRE